MRTVEFRKLLDSQNALRVRFQLRQGRIVVFMVQLECLFDTEWIPVVRYDTAHGFAHCDRMHPYDSTKKTIMHTNNYNDALNFAIQDLTLRWQSYRERFQQWKNQK